MYKVSTNTTGSTQLPLKFATSMHQNFMKKKLYSSLWNYILTLFTKYAEHSIGEQKS